MSRKKQNLSPDTILKNYWRDNNQFADLFNAVLFEGKQIIFPNELEDIDTEESSVMEHRGYAESIKASRDNIKISKRSTSFDAEFVMLGIESQEHVHYAMPMRVMGYDYGIYKKQYDSNAKKYQTVEGLSESEYLSRMKKSDRFTPVITVVVYYGGSPWDGATTLHGMLNIPEHIKPFVNDYKMLLVEAKQNNLQFHNTNNMALFDLLQIILEKDLATDEAKKKVIKYVEKYNVDKNVIMTVASATNRNIDYSTLARKGDFTMHTLFDEIEKQAELSGELKGELKGIQALIESLQEMDVPYTKTQNQIMVKFSLSEDNAQNYMRKFWK